MAEGLQVWDHLKYLKDCLFWVYFIKFLQNLLIWKFEVNGNLLWGSLVYSLFTYMAGLIRYIVWLAVGFHSWWNFRPMKDYYKCFRSMVYLLLWLNLYIMQFDHWWTFITNDRWPSHEVKLKNRSDKNWDRN